MSASEWVRHAFKRPVKALQAKPVRVRNTRAVMRRSGASPWPWDAPVYRGETFRYDEGTPRRPVGE